MKFLNELFNSKLKCKRIGHKKKVIKQKIRKGGSLGYVVEDYIRTKTICKRCDKVLKKVKDEWTDGYTSCSMPSDMWDEMRANGFLVLRTL